MTTSIGNRAALVLAVLPIFALAQPKTKLLDCVGKPPNVLVQSGLDKSKQEIKESSYKDLSRREKKEFIIETNFALSEFISTGLVCYGDPYSELLSNMLQKIKAGNPGKVPSNINVYTTRDPEPNAFAWRDGNLFVNIGLFELLENDAQLAFVLCHEIIHYTHEHSKGKFLHDRAMEKENSGKLLGREVDESTFREIRNIYSQKLETEADEEGLELFLNSGYSITEGTNALRQLQKIGQPSFESSTDAYQLLGITEGTDTLDEKFNEIYNLFLEYKEKYIDSMPTSHPALNLRIENLEQRIERREGIKNTGIVSTEAFRELKKNAPFDVLINEYRIGKYESVLYKCLTQLESADSDFHREYALRCVYALFNSNLEGTERYYTPTDTTQLNKMGFTISLLLLNGEHELLLENLLTALNDENMSDVSYFYFCANSDVRARLKAKRDESDYSEEWYSKYLVKFDNGVYKAVAEARL